MLAQQAEQWQQIRREDYSLLRETMRGIIAEEAYYTLPANASDDDCMDYWFGGRDCEVWTLRENDVFCGSYYLRKNHYELGEHIANAGYMVAPGMHGKGIGKRLALQSVVRAKERGFHGIQFNFVVSTNAPAVHAWQQLGWQIIGTVPGGFHLKHEQYVDAYIMFKDLRDNA